MFSTKEEADLIVYRWEQYLEKPWDVSLITEYKLYLLVSITQTKKANRWQAQMFLGGGNKSILPTS